MEKAPRTVRYSKIDDTLYEVNVYDGALMTFSTYAKTIELKNRNGLQFVHLIHGSPIYDSFIWDVDVFKDVTEDNDN